MIRWLRSLFAWRLDHEAGVYGYFENQVTGARVARRGSMGGYSPLDEDWLARRKLAPCRNHPTVASVTNLDGEDLCQECANAWCEGERQAAFEAEVMEAEYILSPDFP